MPHPLYSPDLARSDFFFGNVKRWLSGQSFAGLDEILKVVLELVRWIPYDTLTRTFRDWMSRLSKYIDTNGDYTD
jgi:hypothetical protein